VVLRHQFLLAGGFQSWRRLGLWHCLAY
jgi:hypothetical protein